jgi:heterodisulfide reductase subunit A-like polyferredoxin
VEGYPCYIALHSTSSRLDSSGSHSPSMSIHLIVIGAGLAGLAAAISTKVANPEHRVTILESVRELAEIGVRTPFLVPSLTSPPRPL